MTPRQEIGPARYLFCQTARFYLRTLDDNLLFKENETVGRATDKVVVQNRPDGMSATATSTTPFWRGIVLLRTLNYLLESKPIEIRFVLLLLLLLLLLCNKLFRTICYGTQIKIRHVQSRQDQTCSVCHMS